MGLVAGARDRSRRAPGRAGGDPPRAEAQAAGRGSHGRPRCRRRGRRRRQRRRAGRRRLRGRRPPGPLRPAQAAAHTGSGGARLRWRRQGVARRELRRRSREPCQRRGRDPRGGPARGRRRRRTSDDGPRGRQGRREAPRGAGRGGAVDPRGSVRALALDYGAARTGVAVSDATGTVARPVGIVERAASDAGLDRVVALVAEHEAELVVVGLPLTLRGERGAQARETEAFVEALRARLQVPVETEDERFTTVLAQRTGGRAPEDALAAAHLLQGWLERAR